MNSINTSFSVVIPTKNRLNSLLRCLESIAKQSIYPNKIIIIDQSKVNNLIELKKKINSKLLNIIFYHHNRNIQGLVSAKKYSLNFCNSEFICFLEDDLYLEKDFLNTLYQSFTSKNIMGVSGVITNHPKKTFIFNFIFDIFHIGIYNDIRYKIYNSLVKINSSKLIYSDKLSGGITMWRSKVFKKVLFDTQNFLHFTEDIDFSSRIVSEFGKSTYINPSARTAHDIVQDGRVDDPKKIQLKIKEYKIFYSKRKSFVNLLTTSWLLIGFFIESIFKSIFCFKFKYILFFFKGLLS